MPELASSRAFVHDISPFFLCKPLLVCIHSMQLRYCNILTYQRAKGERAWGEHKTGEKWEESKREGGRDREERNRSANILTTPFVHERGEQ